LTKKVVQSLIL